MLGKVNASKVTSAPPLALSSTCCSRVASTLVGSFGSRTLRVSGTCPAKSVRLCKRPTTRISSPSRRNAGVFSSTKKSLRVRVAAVACPTSVSTEQPRAVRRQAVVVSGILMVAVALPSAPVMIEGNQRPSPRTSRRGAGCEAAAGLLPGRAFLLLSANAKSDWASSEGLRPPAPPPARDSSSRSATMPCAIGALGSGALAGAGRATALPNCRAAPARATTSDWARTKRLFSSVRALATGRVAPG